jgi:hypothetical protein
VPSGNSERHPLELAPTATPIELPQTWQLADSPADCEALDIRDLATEVQALHLVLSSPVSPAERLVYLLWVLSDVLGELVEGGGR